ATLSDWQPTSRFMHAFMLGTTIEVPRTYKLVAIILMVMPGWIHLREASGSLEPDSRMQEGATQAATQGKDDRLKQKDDDHRQ
ncbi:MAG: hypothetical protein ACK56F_10350, partial [bacterium]